jgi:hypothetical protein
MSSAIRHRQKMNNAQKKRPIIVESDSDHENSSIQEMIEEEDEEPEVKVMTSQKKNRKRVPV